MGVFRKPCKEIALEGPWEVVKLCRVAAVERRGESGATTALPPAAGECMREPEAWGWTHAKAPRWQQL